MRSAWNAMEIRNIADWKVLGADLDALSAAGGTLVTPSILNEIDQFTGVIDAICARAYDMCFVDQCDHLAHYTCDGPGCGQRICKSSDHSTKTEDGRRLCVECLGEGA
jgi:hypothetical protein